MTSFERTNEPPLAEASRNGGAASCAALAEPAVEHGEEERLDQHPPVVGDGRVGLGVALERDAHPGARELGVGDDREQRLVVIGDVGHDALARRARRLQAGEPLADRLLHLGGVEVADGDDRLEVGPIPVAVEPRDLAVREAFEHLHRADRDALGVPRALEQDRELLVLHPGARAAPPAPLLDHDAALLVDLLAVERDAAGPVLQDLEAALEDLGVVGRDLQHVDGLVEAGVGVEVGPEAHADAFEVVDQLVAGEAAGAVEGHVLDEVGEAALGVVLDDRADVDQQSQLRPRFRLGVGADVVVRPLSRRPVRTASSTGMTRSSA